mgnify:CR=1 FL=1
MKKGAFSSTIEQKALDFLSRDPHSSFYAAEIASRLGLSKGGVNQSLRKMAEEGLLRTEHKGRMIFYSVDPGSALVKQFKILNNVAALQPLVGGIKDISQRAVLFGSCASGENTGESDIDLFVVTDNKEKVKKLVLSNGRSREKIQLILKTPQEYMGFEKKEPVFFDEIAKGVVLWQKD